MERTKRWLSRLDSLFEYAALLFLVAMTLIIAWQVFSRYVLNHTPNWSEELALVLMVWVGFFGIALGFRERLHIAIELFVRRMPERVQRVIEKAIYGLIVLFGLYLVVQGSQFTALANLSTLPGTGLPSGVLYACMPISGVMVCVYGLLQLVNVRTEKDRHSGDGATGQEVEPRD